MTDDVPLKKWASIQVNNDFINIMTRSGYRMYLADLEKKNTYLATDASNKELGQHIREALSLSRFVHPIENKELSMYLRDPDRYKEWLKTTMEKFGYKTKTKMLKPMLDCHVTLYNQMIKLEPWHQYKLEGWDGEGLTEADNVIIPETCTDEELGAAARLALSRCTSKFIDKDD